MPAYVYRLVHRPTGKFYIGSTDLIDDRKFQHMESLRKGTHQNVRLQRFYDKKGKKGWEFEVHEVKNRKVAYEHEARLILKYLDNPKLMNIGKGSVGGDNLSRHPDRELIIARMTLSVQQRWDNASPEFRQHHSEQRTGKNNGMYGKQHTEQSRKQMSEKKKGQVPWSKGQTFSEEHRAKIAANARNRTGEKNPFYGKKHSAETIEKIKLSNATRDTSFLDKQRKQISVDGTVYPSLSDAKRATGIPGPTLSWRANNTKPEYDNIFYLNKCPTTIESTRKRKRVE